MTSRVTMGGGWRVALLNVIGIAAMALMVANGILYTQNREKQAQVTSRAQYLQQSAQLEVLYRDMAKGMAELAVKNNDSRLMDVLATQGITVNRPASAALAVAPVKADTAPKR